MKFKLFLIIGLSALISCNSQQQDNKTTENKDKTAICNMDQDDLKAQFTTDISNYLDAFNKEDWDKVISMIYPKLFEFIPQEQMLQTFTQLDGMGMEIKSDFEKVDKISKVISYKGLRYCRVYYKGRIIIKIKGVMLDNVDLLKLRFNEGYGDDNVKYDDANNEFDIYAIKSMIAISDIDSNEWTYIEYNESDELIMKEIIPESVLEQLND